MTIIALAISGFDQWESLARHYLGPMVNVVTHGPAFIPWTVDNVVPWLTVYILWRRSRQQEQPPPPRQDTPDRRYKRRG